MPLYGRDPELVALHALTEAARQSRSGVLVIRGAPGTGKSALLDDVAVGSPGMRVLRATGIQGEAELAFAGLHQLVWPLRNLIGQSRRAARRPSTWAYRPVTSTPPRLPGCSTSPPPR
jgi:AAA ATPase-like protein